MNIMYEYHVEINEGGGIALYWNHPPYGYNQNQYNPYISYPSVSENNYRENEAIIVTPEDSRASVDLGDGFQRHDFYYDIRGRESKSLHFRGGNVKPISAAVFCSCAEPLPLLSHPHGMNDWKLMVRNPLSAPTQVGFFIYTKR
jgi:hypothetical protein